MKKLFLAGSAPLILLSLIFFFVKGTFAQPVHGKKFELSTSASVWNVKYKDRETDTTINIRLRFGIFLFKGLEIEPEILLEIPEERDYTGYLFFANLAYNFKASKKLIPFLLAGAGFGNGPRFYSGVIDYEMSVTAYNFGAGIKCLISNSAAIRIEYRFTKYSGKQTGSSWWWNYELDRTDNNIFAGLSIFF